MSQDTPSISFVHFSFNERDQENRDQAVRRHVGSYVSRTSKQNKSGRGIGSMNIQVDTPSDPSSGWFMPARADLRRDMMSICEIIDATPSTSKADRPDVEEDSRWPRGRLDYLENGRTYHGFHPGKYLLPNDDREQDRLDFFHQVLFEVTRQSIHVPCPPSGRVLDLGCGTGIWVMDFAKTYPDACVIGVDLSPIQPSNKPRNSHFYAPFDFEFPWGMDEGCWDVIRLQMGSGSVVNWPNLYHNILLHLRDGAWFEQIEIDFEPKCEDRTLDGSILRYWYQNLKQATEDSGRSIHHHPATTLRQLHNAGFTCIQHEEVMMPLNRWHQSDRLQHIAHWYGSAFFDSIEPLSLAPFTRRLDWSPEQIQCLIEDVKLEARSTKIHSFQVLHIYKAQKPSYDVS